ncbi:hypothetical protein C8J57DRAFT_1283972 [Mycena rebaudengoi]|nr:hypothetical protein C8J57DRAFT_1283972 [Mycena rebaudengoi]
MQHKHRYAQRKHIIQSLDILLYQLHIFAFFLSPSIWTLIFRIVSQFQCSKARDLDAAWSLRTFLALLVSLNSVTIYHHATEGASSDSKTVILDFIGMAYTPTKFRLLSLDIFIVFLQMVLAIIAYETSLAKNNLNVLDNLLPPSDSSTTAIPNHTKSYPPRSSTPYVIDLRFSAVIARLRHPLPLPSTVTSLDGLPLPNTTPWPLPAAGLRMLFGALPGRSPDASGGATNGTGEGEDGGRIPGALDR